MTGPCVLLTAAAQQALRDASPRCYGQAAAFGEIGLYAVDRLERPDGTALGRGTLLPRRHPLSDATGRVDFAFHRAPAAAHGAQLAAAWRDHMLTFEGLRAHVPALQLANGALVITWAPDHAEAGVPEFAAWLVASDGAQALDVETEPDEYGALCLEPRWPARRLQDEHVLQIGAGTIGTAAALGLGAYGVGRISLIDPDRLRFSNLKRLPFGPQDVGQRKVDVVARAVREAWPGTGVEPLPLDAVRDAAVMRGLAADASLVVCTADGVLPRRVASHVARRAGIDCVMACVLDDGAVGEVLRLRALAGHGCLRCQREALREDGVLERFDPEADLHRAYGDGILHKPMTAVGGDLSLVGQAAAKVAVATLLHNAGRGAHELPGEALLLPLRASDLVRPYGADAALQGAWLPASPSRPGCFTCGPDAAAPAAHGARGAA